MTLTVLNDDEIRTLLEGLTAAELEGFRGALVSALHEHSSASTQGSTGADGTSAIQQPERTSVHSTATGATTLFMPSSSSVGNGVKVITLSSASTSTNTTSPSSAVIRPTGAIALFTPRGGPHGLLHASTLTAFRTALASLCLVRGREAVRNLVVFGCGEQAYWHVRLALKARGSHVERVVFVNPRASQTAREVVGRFVGRVEEDVKVREGWARCEFAVVIRDEEGEAYEERLAALLREADVVVCCTPSTEELFDVGVLGEREEGKLVVAIGSYTPEMREVPVSLIRQAVQREGGVVVVDTAEGVLKEAGEFIAAGVKREQLVELGELTMLNTAEARSTEQSGKERESRLMRWLQTGNVIYKSVGLGLMDLTVGMYLVDFATDRGIGTLVPGF
ncbi:Delta(1)-pyrroline-2-carboxylate reductase [Madurella mycetomatis]|uniref:Delta(1)-pyrroline-2-carboxylate reductase n=1 Tax=Madurella mycetomatis TaxID=100816 RepID=A0A175VVC1_9PEZI|nr:Delta(1)-pyrroline-2-carboxylate reductase [Madurella mycetomatis]